ncbi:galactose-binding domain-like protein [Aspergillus avenaceus]|uniref:Galactose-binding domain-like protein n=1 Tax=Aspergillus avenaceus TaxID=36643 RepID=A0A5N6TSU9_ASPAV|nr:galactose-binding domain-like protein [Aspergillus avenaceus]
MPRHFLRRHEEEDQSRAPRARLGHASQYHTPPSRDIPQLHPSSGPVEPVEPAHPAAAAQAALFSLFGRGVSGRPPRPQLMEDDHDDEESQFDDEELHDTFGPQDEQDFDENELEEDVGDDLEEIDEDEDMDRARSPSPLPSNLREISSLASWTVSTHKPGCGVSALRHASPTQYWQSDGPQPHTLTLHFFKLVAVVKIRVYLNFDLDESYTPTKMTFHAGMGGNDLVEFATWEGEGPCGWVDVPLEGVGGRSGGWVRRRGKKQRKSRAAWPEYIFDAENMEVEGDDRSGDEEDGEDPYAGSVLKAMVIQMRIMENHQNGKDTHVRGFQVFARDDERRRVGTAPSASADARTRRHSVRKSLRGAEDALERDEKVSGLEEPDWMGEPVIR